MHGLPASLGTVMYKYGVGDGKERVEQLGHYEESQTRRPEDGEEWPNVSSLGGYLKSR